MHHVGSASARIVGELAERHPGVVPSDPDQLRDFFAFRDFAHFVEVYLSVVDLIVTAEDIRYLTYEVAREMAEGQRIRYAELTCTPYTSVQCAASRSRRTPRRSRTRGPRRSATSAWCCAGSTTSRGRAACPRPTRRSATRSTTGWTRWSASGSAGRRSACLAHSSSRTSTPPAPPGCTACRTPARRPGPETIWESLRLLGAERIGHGTSAALDPELLAHLAETGIALEVCPSSNVATRAVASLAEHPLRSVRRGRA